jgi:hypothetical protein
MNKQNILVACIAATFGLPVDTGAAEQDAADSTTDGKYYLIWRVTASKVEVGAEVEVEPAFFTNGKRVVFAWDYCRQYYVKKHQPQEIPSPFIYGRRNILDPQYLLNDKDIGEDLGAFHSYCEYQDLTLAGARYVLLDNHGVRLTVRDVSFKAPKLPDWQVRRLHPPLFPKAGRSVIATVQGRVPEKLPAARQANQPYGFLMATNGKLLERIVPADKPTAEEQKQFDVRLNRYIERRQKGGVIEPPPDQCRSNVPDMYAPEAYRLKSPNLNPPQLLERFFADFDRDGRMDMTTWVRESDLDSTLRIFFASGKEVCGVLGISQEGGSFQFRYPANVVRIGDCYCTTAKGVDVGGRSLQTIVTTYGPENHCPSGFSEFYLINTGH